MEENNVQIVPSHLPRSGAFCITSEGGGGKKGKEEKKNQKKKGGALVISYCVFVTTIAVMAEGLNGEGGRRKEGKGN